VVYSQDFYIRLTAYRRYSILGYYKDVLVGAVSCRYEDEMTEVEEGSEEEPKPTGNKVVYIMTITVLKPYRRYQIGTQLLDRAIEDCTRGDVSKIYLHVLCSNHSAQEFYKKAGFIIKKKLENYYTDLEPPHCYIFEKDLTEYKKKLNIGAE